MDFTLNTYQTLLESLLQKGFSFISFAEYMEGLRPEYFVILRHDVDLLPGNSLEFARLQHKMGIRGTYYFRVVKESWNEEIINEIAALGHEVGYHYEDMDLVKVGKGESREEKALQLFEKHLEKIRKLSEVKTICMHGSPRSAYDNKDIWKHNNYRDYGIIGEPYFDGDFDSLFYLTDTGRRWDGWKVSVRDKLPQQKKWVEQGLVFNSTNDIIQALKEDRLPHQLMMTFHPQRWTNKPLPWIKELVLQKMKNIVKRGLVFFRERF